MPRSGLGFALLGLVFLAALSAMGSGAGVSVGGCLTVNITVNGHAGPTLDDQDSKAQTAVTSALDLPSDYGD
jgi:hypothetical protein